MMSQTQISYIAVFLAVKGIFHDFRIIWYTVPVAKKKKKKQFKLKAGYIILAFLLAFCILGGIYLSQQTRLDSIAAQKKELQTQLDELEVEEERLTRTLEYMNTTDYLIQYAREKLGYIFPDDYKFVD